MQIDTSRLHQSWLFCTMGLSYENSAAHLERIPTYMMYNNLPNGDIYCESSESVLRPRFLNYRPEVFLVVFHMFC
jgi:hypothetical protein